MHCFQFLKLRHNKVDGCPKLSASVDKINDLLRKNGKSGFIKPIDQLGPLIYELIHNEYRFTNKIDIQFIHDLLATIHNFKILNVNNLKNFLNQSLLHFACENNQVELCKILVEYGADCLQEDNYLQTPLILAAKRNYFEIVKIFSTYINLSGQKNEVLRATYYACYSGNCQIVKYLIDQFGFYTEELVDVKDSNRISELNPLHVCCHKSYSNIIVCLLSKFQNSSLIGEYLNQRFNEYRDSTALEEAFKGFVSLFSTSSNTVNSLKKKNSDMESKILEYRKIINILIENGARFSTNFSVTNGLFKLATQNKDFEFLHFLNCCNFLFKFRLKEIFVLVDQNQLEFMMDEFIPHIYKIYCKVVKDLKSKCLNVFIDMVLNLHHSGQYYVQEKKFFFLKEKNEDVLNLLLKTTRKNLTLKHFCAISIRNSIKSYGIEKVQSLNIPNELKKELFFNSLSKKNHPEFDYYTFLLIKSINNTKFV